jgi:hypothetical protein
MVTDYTIILGLLNQAGDGLVIAPDAAKKHIKKVITNKYYQIPGATLSDCEGVYTMNNGIQVTEPSIKIEITINSDFDATTKEQILLFAKDLKNTFSQESIYFNYRENSNATLIF